MKKDMGKDMCLMRYKVGVQKTYYRVRILQSLEMKGYCSWESEMHSLHEISTKSIPTSEFLLRQMCVFNGAVQTQCTAVSAFSTTNILNHEFSKALVKEPRCLGVRAAAAVARSSTQWRASKARLICLKNI